MEQIRWQQRFHNLERAYKKLKRGLQIFDYDQYLEKRDDLRGNLDTNDEGSVILAIEELDLEREGIIQRFEYTYELFILTLKDFLEYTGETSEVLSGKRGILKKALQNNLIDDHDNWRKMLESRNLTSHTYNEETADEITESIIKVYFPLMQKLYSVLERQIDE